MKRCHIERKINLETWKPWHISGQMKQLYLFYFSLQNLYMTCVWINIQTVRTAQFWSRSDEVWKNLTESFLPVVQEKPTKFLPSFDSVAHFKVLSFSYCFAWSLQRNGIYPQYWVYVKNWQLFECWVMMQEGKNCW